LKTSGDDITMNNVNEEEEESASEEEDGDQEDQEDEDVDEEAEQVHWCRALCLDCADHAHPSVTCWQALQEAVEMQDVTADSNDQDDENEDNSDDDADPSKPELLGVLIRTPDAKTGEDDGDNDDGIVFVGVDALKDAFEDALSEIQQEQESGTDDDDDIDLEEAEWEPPKTKADGLATRVATGLSIIEFVIMLYVLAMDKVPVELLKEPPGQAVFDAFLLRAGTSQFWMEFGIYCFLFFLLPIVVGLLFGKHNTPESVLGYALSR